jgi:proteasome lid subunit RPN8/RPN11
VVNEGAKGLPSQEDWSEAKREPTSRWSGSGNQAFIGAALLQQVIDAARAGVPNEACGLLVSDRYFGDGGGPLRYVPLRNAAQSPYRYMIDPTEQLDVWMAFEEADEIVWAIVHSHVASPAEPSATDVGLAFFPESLYVICSLSEWDQPAVRAWSIVDGAVSEVHLAVTE